MALTAAPSVVSLRKLWCVLSCARQKDFFRVEKEKLWASTAVSSSNGRCCVLAFSESYHNKYPLCGELTYSTWQPLCCQGCFEVKLPVTGNGNESKSSSNWEYTKEISCVRREEV